MFKGIFFVDICICLYLKTCACDNSFFIWCYCSDFEMISQLAYEGRGYNKNNR